MIKRLFDFARERKHSQLTNVEKHILSTKIYLTKVYPCYTCLAEEWHGFTIFLN